MQLLKIKNLLKYGEESTLDVIDDLDFCSKKLQVIMSQSITQCPQMKSRNRADAGN